MAADLREKPAQLAAAASAAAAASYRAGHDEGTPGEVSVTVTGDGQVSQVYVGPRAMRSGAAALPGLLPALVNRAVQGARDAGERVLAETTGPALGQAISEAARPAGPEAAEFAATLAEQTVGARSPGGTVAVAARGTGEITRVEFSATALRGDDNVTLGTQIAAALNGALAAARAAQTRLVTTGQADRSGRDLTAFVHEQMTAFDRQVGDQVGAFDRRMGELMDQLDETTRRLVDLP